MTLRRNCSKFETESVRRLQSSHASNSSEEEPETTPEPVLATGEQDYGLAYQNSYKGGFDYSDLRDADYGSIP